MDLLLLLLVVILHHGNNLELVELLPHHGNNQELVVPHLHLGQHLVLVIIPHPLPQEIHHLVAIVVVVLLGNQVDTIIAIQHPMHRLEDIITMLMDLMDTMMHLKHLHQHRQVVQPLGNNNPPLPHLHQIKVQNNG